MLFCIHYSIDFEVLETLGGVTIAGPCVLENKQIHLFSEHRVGCCSVVLLFGLTQLSESRAPSQSTPAL